MISRRRRAAILTPQRRADGKGKAEPREAEAEAETAAETAADGALVWRTVVADVLPLPGRPVLPTDPEPAAPPSADEGAPRSMADAAVVIRPRIVAVPADLGHGRTPGLDKRSAERLRKGEMVIDGRLDLHGMTQDAAHAALLGFVARAYDNAKRCLLVITGKGQGGEGVLRAQVPRWLNQSPLRALIVGFSFARPKDGGEGALYVLVRRRRA